jgi:hypothetical protein
MLNHKAFLALAAFVLAQPGMTQTEHVAKSAPDGYAVLAGATTVIAANPALFKQLGYNLRTDFDAVIGLGTIPQVVVVHPSIPAKNMAEFVAYAKQNPGKLFYASGTAGNIIPSRITDGVAGRVPMMAVDVSAAPAARPSSPRSRRARSIAGRRWCAKRIRSRVR